MPTIDAMSRTRRSGWPATHARTRKWLVKNAQREIASPEPGAFPGSRRDSTASFLLTDGMSVVSRPRDVTLLLPRVHDVNRLALKTVARGLFEKIWDAHAVREAEGEPT